MRRTSSGACYEQGFDVNLRSLFDMFDGNVWLGWPVSSAIDEEKLRFCDDRRRRRYHRVLFVGQATVDLLCLWLFVTGVAL